MTAVLQLRDIHKRFGTTVALDGAGLTLHQGELHGLLGENGAGKSTLMRIACGLEPADQGEIVVDGRIVSMRSAREARRLGIGMVHQHPTSIPSLTVAENVALAAGWRVRPRELQARVADLCRNRGLPLEPEAYAGRLPIALRQRLEIVKALAADARILLLDEPTAVLAPSESEELLRMLRRYVAAGNSAVLITHKLSEAVSTADNVTVMRHGRVTLTESTLNSTSESLATAMIGRGADIQVRRSRSRAAGDTAGSTLVQLDALDVARGGRYGIALRGAALTLRAGEVVGVAAVEGNGHRELLRVMAGLIEPLRGTISVRGPVAFVPEDRTTEGLIPTLSLSENFVLGLGGAAPGVHGRRIAWREADAATAAAIATFRILAPGPGARAGTLSGGNQQKLVLARALAGSPQVIVAENPARGLDVAAAAEVFQRLREAAAGAAVIFHSTDLDEVLAESDRVVVVCGGSVREAPDRSRDTIGRMMVGLA